MAALAEAIGTHANAWNNVAAGINGTSNAVDLQGQPYMTVFGTSSAAATITVQVSHDGTNWYDSTLTAAPGAGAAFFINSTIGARYARLKTSAASTITATIGARG